MNIPILVRFHWIYENTEFLVLTVLSRHMKLDAFRSLTDNWPKETIGRERDVTFADITTVYLSQSGLKSILTTQICRSPEVGPALTPIGIIPL